MKALDNIETNWFICPSCFKDMPPSGWAIFHLNEDIVYPCPCGVKSTIPSRLPSKSKTNTLKLKVKEFEKKHGKIMSLSRHNSVIAEKLSDVELDRAVCILAKRLDEFNEALKKIEDKPLDRTIPLPDPPDEVALLFKYMIPPLRGKINRDDS